MDGAMVMLTELWVLSFVFVSVQAYDYIKWRWSEGSEGGYSVVKAEEHYFGSRSGAAYNNGLYFGGLQYDANNKKYTLKNDLWRGLHTIEHPGQGAGKTDSSFPSPRQLTAMCGISGVIYVVFGGLGEKGMVLGDTWLYMYKEKKWINFVDKEENKKLNKTIMVPPARGEAAVWCLKDRLIIKGGVGADGSILDDMWQFSLVDLNWSPTKFYQQYKTSFKKHLLSYPKPRHGGHTWVSRDQQTLYLFGGNIQRKGQSSNTGYCSDLWKYTVSTGVWLKLNGPSGSGHHGVAEYTWKHSRKYYPGGRCGGATATDYHGNLWLFGGLGANRDPDSVSSKNPPVVLGDVWNYNVNLNQWALFDPGTPKGYYVEQNKFSKRSWPRPRYNMIFDVSLSGTNRMWLYGGIGRNDENTQEIHLDDKWSLDYVQYNQYYNVMYGGTLFLFLFCIIGAVIFVIFIYRVQSCPSKCSLFKKLPLISKGKLKVGSEENYAPLIQET